MSVKPKKVRVRVSFEYVVDEAMGDAPFSKKFDREYVKDKLEGMRLKFGSLRVERVKEE